jgi:hypothetical protein
MSATPLHDIIRTSRLVTLFEVYMAIEVNQPLAPGRAGRSGDRIPVGGEIFRTCPERLSSPPSHVYKECRVIAESKATEAWR